MLRRLNYTNRVRIHRADLRIALSSPDGGLRFTADLSKLREYSLPKDALVFVEAYRQANWMRFDFGKLGALDVTGERHLSQFDSPEGIRFRVKVTPSHDDRILLAEADRIPLFLPDQDLAPKQPLLPVKPADLDGEVHRLDFSGTEPLLLISRRAGSYGDIGRSPAFLALVYPAVLKEILVRALILDQFEDDSSDDDWQSRWLRFAKSLPGVGELPDTSSDQDDRFKWIDDAVAAFSRRVDVHGRFAEFWKEGA